MSDKLQLKGNVIVSDSDIDDWFEFETKVLKAIKNNQKHTVNAVCEFKQYVGPEIMGSFKLKGDLCTWTNFAVQVITEEARRHDWIMSCTVTLKAGRKGKMAEQALENDMDMFATTKVESPFEVYEKNKELIDGMFQAGKRDEDSEIYLSSDDTVIEDAEGS